VRADDRNCADERTVSTVYRRAMEEAMKIMGSRLERIPPLRHFLMAVDILDEANRAQTTAR